MNQLEEIKARAEGHTEGPWVIAADLPTWESEEGSFDVGPDDAPTVAVVEGLANADLIAVAPKLLAALEEVERELRALDQVFGKDDDVIHAVITQVRQAITEALA